MLRPAISQILKNNESYYSLVIAVAKRARQLSDDAYNEKITLEDKPVNTAINEFARGEFKIIEDPSLGH